MKCDQEVFPHVGCRGSQLDFLCHSRQKKQHRLESNLFGIGRKMFNPDRKDAATPENALFSNKTPNYLFSHAELFLYGKLISSSNNNYHHAAFVDTELTTDPVTKKTWTVCSGYQYVANKDKNLELKDKIMEKFDNDGRELHMSTFWIANNN